MSDLPPIIQKIGMDTGDYKTGVIEINRSIRVIESGFRAAAAGLADWSRDASGLEMRIKALSSEIELQQKKVEATRAEYERVRKEKGENSRAAQDLQIKLNKETETLNKMQGELDQTEASLKKMGSEEKDTKKKTEDLDKSEDKAARATVHFGDTLGGLTRHLKSAAAGMGHMIGSVGKLAMKLATGLAIAAGAAGAAIVGMMASTIGPASDLNETISKVGVVFGDFAEDVIHFGEAAATSMGMSENTALAAAGTFGNLFRAMGMGNEVSANMSMGLVKLAGDLASFNNMDPTEVLDKLRAGISGESEPLKALGVNINETIIKEKARELGLWNGIGALDANAKAQAAYALIMEQTTLAQGDFERTSEGLANQQRILAAQVENLKGKIGTALLPVVVMAVKLLNDFLANPKFQEGLQRLTDGIAGLTTKITNAVSAKGLKGGLLSLIMPEGGLESLGGSLLDKIGGFIGKLLSKMLTSFVAKPAQLLNIGLNIIQGLGTGLLAAMPALLNVFLQLITGMVSFITQMLPMLMQTGLTIIMRLAMAIMQAIPQLIPVVFQIINNFVKFLIQNLPMLINAAIVMIATLANGIAQALPELIPTIMEIIPVVVNSLLANLPILIEAALEIIMALATGIIDALPALISAVPQIVQTIVDIIIENFPLVIETAIILLTTIVNAIINNLPLIGAAAVQIITSLLLGIATMIPEIIKSAGMIIQTIVDAVADLLPTILQVGTDIVKGIWKGIQDAWAQLLEDMAGIIAGLPEWVKKLLGIASPSKVFEGIGKNMALGLGAGFANSFGDIKNMIGSAVAGLNASANFGGGLAPAYAVAGGGSRYEITVKIEGGTGVERESATQGVMAAARAIGLVP